MCLSLFRFYFALSLFRYFFIVFVTYFGIELFCYVVLCYVLSVVDLFTYLRRYFSFIIGL